MRGNTFALSYVLQRRKKYLSTDSQYQISVLYLNHNFVHISKSQFTITRYNHIHIGVYAYSTLVFVIRLQRRHILFMYYHHISGSQRE